MPDDQPRVRIQLLDGRHLETQGTLEEIAHRLGPDAVGTHGFSEIIDPRGNAILVNREHVLYIERRGQSRAPLGTR